MSRKFSLLFTPSHAEECDGRLTIGSHLHILADPGISATKHLHMYSDGVQSYIPMQVNQSF